MNAGERSGGPPETVMEVRCCIVGGGPAGLMLALLLARAGVEVLVLEKHGDFLRDFRGDTIHPSTLEVLKDLGLLEPFLALPHRKVREVSALIGGRHLTLADFSHLAVAAPYVAFLPQWDFLNFVTERAERCPAFRLLREVEGQALVERQGRVVGVMAEGPQGALRIEADLVVAADGRHSRMRAAAGLPVETLGAPIDVLWFRLPRGASQPQGVLGVFQAGAILVLLDRGEYWQCGFVIAKDGLKALKARGLGALREELTAAAPFLETEIATLADWGEVKLLSVQVDRLKRWWRPGLLAIGDAAHAMSPVAGVGINLAIQDAVAAANLLARPLSEGPRGQAPPEELLARLERRRLLPTRLTQRAQLLVQNRILKPVLGSRTPLDPPLLLRLLAASPLARRLAGRLIGLGVRPERPEVGERGVERTALEGPWG